MDRCFSVDGQHVRTGIDEGRDVLIGIGDHQMHVQRQFGRLPDGFHDWRADGDVRHEMAVHHVHMEQMGACLLHCADVFTQRRKVRRKDRRGDSNAHWLTSRRIRSDFDIR